MHGISSRYKVCLHNNNLNSNQTIVSIFLLKKTSKKWNEVTNTYKTINLQSMAVVLSRGFTIKNYIRKKHSIKCALKIDQTSRDVVLCVFSNIHTKKNWNFSWCNFLQCLKNVSQSFLAKLKSFLVWRKKNLSGLNTNDKIHSLIKVMYNVDKSLCALNFINIFHF